MKFSTILLATIFAGTAMVSHAAERLDQVAIIVNDGVVLKSEINSLVNSVKRRSLASKQELPADRILRTQATERLIDTILKEQIADRMGMRIGDVQLNQTIEGIAQEQKMTISDLKQAIEKDGDSFAKYRESIRSELLLSQVERISVRRRINISEHEISNLVELMNERGKTNTEYHIGHILIPVDKKGTAEEQQASKSRADKVLEMLKEGSDFKKIAITSSSGPKALEGGDWGLMNINEMPTLFTDAVKDHSKGDIIGPVRSGNGYHILTIFDIKGKQEVKVSESNARHILIKTSIILSNDRAKELLNDFIKQIEAGTATFSDLAKEHSADSGSAIKGGELGWADPSNYVPEFKNTMARLNEGEMSKPFKTTHGWHIIEFIGRRNIDATESFIKNRAYQLLFNRKFAEESAAWANELRAQAYIDVLDTGAEAKD